MKRIMMLGGSHFLLPAIKAAHKLGLYVITCDYLPDNIAHKYSDQYCNISTTDKEALLTKARELKIDGITSFACDSGVVSAAYVAEKMGLPTNGPYESICILQNKWRFRKFLKDNGFTVPIAKGYSSIESALKDIGSFHWPVIVKPVDSCGSKGVMRVDSPNMLRGSIEAAIPFSQCGQFIIEEFVEKKGDSSDSDCFTVDGKLKFVSFSNQRFDENATNPYTPAGFSWPSSMSDEHQKELTSELQRLLKLLHMGTAIYNVESREGIDGKAYIMEVSPRGGGNRLAEMIRFATGVDLISNMVKASVGMPVADVEQRPYSGCWAEIILHSDREGIFDALWISDEIKYNIIEQDLWIKSGDAVRGFSGANATIGTLVLKFETEEKLAEVMNHMKKYVKVVLKT